MAVYYPRCRAVLQVISEDYLGGLDRLTSTYEVVPVEVEIRRNAARKADTFSMVLDLRDFPLDPRTIRSCRVQIVLGDALLATGDVSVYDITKTVFVGYADEIEGVLTGDGEQVTLKGRDTTALYLDYPWPGKMIDVSAPLSVVVPLFMAQVPGALGSPVVFDPGAEAGLVGLAIGRTKFSPQPGDDAWTVLSDLVGRLGLVPTFEKDTLRIRSPGLYGLVPAVMMYGQNLSELSYKRRANDARQKQVVVRAWSARLGVASEGKWPLVPTHNQVKVGVTGLGAKTPEAVIPFYVAGDYTPVDLQLIAQRIYEDRAREQVEGRLQTAEMRDLSLLVDLVQLKNGDAVQVNLGKLDATALSGLSDAEAIAYLVGAPARLSVVVATALVNSWRQAEVLQTLFYVKEAGHRWTRDAGYTLEVDFINYV